MKNTQQHPEFPEESLRLEKTYQYIDRELGGVENAQPHYDRKNELKSRHQHLSKKHISLSRAYEDSPYYGRFDFQEDGANEIEEFYVSKYEGLQLQHAPVRVIYWASPAGTIFSQKKRSTVSYLAPEGEIQGKVFLRRQLTIQQQELTEVFDEFDRRKRGKTDEQPSIDDDILRNPDEYLRYVLEGRSGRGLQEIVASIQERQDDIMRAPADQVLIVQGPAGSGKTSIALHRVAVLLYVPEGYETKDPTRIMIVGANNLFLRFVSQVLPNINIDNVPQRTFVDWASRMTGYQYFTRAQDHTFNEVFHNSKKKTAELAYRRSKLKGSLRIMSILEELVNRYRWHVPMHGLAIYPSGLGSLGMFYTLTTDDLQHFVEEARDLPVNQHIRSIKSKVSQHLIDQHQRNFPIWIDRIATIVNNPSATMDKHQVNKWEAQLQEYGYQWVNGNFQIPNFEDEAQLRRAEARRNRALRSVQDEISKLVDREFPKPYSPLQLYNDLLTDADLLERVLKIPSKKQQEQIKKQNDEESIELDEKLEYYKLLLHDSEITENNLCIEDVAPLTYLHLLLEGRGLNAQSYDHILIDEAQDTSPLEMWLLRSVTSTGSMTILGDLAQSIHSYRGVRQWDEFLDVFVADKWQYEEIEQTYRSTYEIMTFANKILASPSLKTLHYQQADPFVRHGEPVKMQAVRTYKEQYTFIVAETERLLAKRYTSIAIICKSPQECEEIASHLHVKDKISSDTSDLTDNIQITVGVVGGV